MDTGTDLLFFLDVKNAKIYTGQINLEMFMVEFNCRVGLVDCRRVMDA